MAYKRIHVSKLAPDQSARRLSTRDGTGEFDNTYVIRASAGDVVGKGYIYVYPNTGMGCSWSVFEEPIDEIVEVEV